MQGEISQKKPLVYADIGPRSLERRSHTSTLDIQSHRVEYAQLNYNAQNNTQKIESNLRMKADPPGMYQTCNLN